MHLKCCTAISTHCKIPAAIFYCQFESAPRAHHNKSNRLQKFILVIMNFAGIDDDDGGGVANVRDQGRVTTPYVSPAY